MTRRRGRKPKPTALRVVTGNPGKRAMPRNEPTPEPAVPEKPDFLDDVASAEWDRIVPELERLGLLTQLDRAILVKYCQAWSAVAGLEIEIRKDGWWVETGQGGKKRNPAAACLNEAYTRLHSAAAELGGTPSARVRLAAPGKRDVDPRDELVVRRRRRQ